MAYDKYTWQTGEVITQEKLNHMEDGIADMGGGGMLIVNVISPENEPSYLDKTWQEIHDAFLSGNVAFRGINNGYEVYFPIDYVGSRLEGNEYFVSFTSDNPFATNFSTTTPDGHPTVANS